MNPEFIYIRSTANHPIGAVAVECLGGNKVKVAVSKCHEKDIFVRNVARNKVLGRLQAKKGSQQNFIFDLDDEVSFTKLAFMIKTRYNLDTNQIDCVKNFIRSRIERANA